MYLYDFGDWKLQKISISLLSSVCELERRTVTIYT